MPEARLRFLGANRQVTGSRYLLEAVGSRVLVDCGMFQERAFLGRNWEPTPFDPDSIHEVMLTHAHLDHSGLLPRLIGDGYDGRITMTPPTAELAQIVLEDAAEIQEEDAAYKRRRHRREGRTGPHEVRPLYTKRDAEATIDRFRHVNYGKPTRVGEGLEMRFHDAGHILGSALLEVVVAGGPRIVFSGDLGPWDRQLSTDPSLMPEADVVIMESTYGDRLHGTEQGLVDQLARILNDTIERGGNLIVPTFAIDRAQSMLYSFAELVRSGRIPRVTIFLDSPMAIDVTRVYKEYKYLLDEETHRRLDRGEHPFQFDGLHFVRTRDESRAINTYDGTCVILAGSGMCTGGRVKHHLRQNITRPESTVLFVGYQSRGTLGRRILDGDESVRIHGREYVVKARIERLEGLSAHADRDDLLRWLGGFERPPRHLFLTHGEEEAAEALAATVAERLGWKAVIPDYGQEFGL